MRRFRTLFLLVLGALALSACQLDVKVNVAMNADGTGEVVVVASVDADVVSQVPGLEGSLVLDDATSAGWVVEGPTATEDGGLTVTLRHPFASAAEAAVLVNSLGPPFQGIALERVATEDEITTTLTGSFVLANGFDSFGDANLVAAAGAMPFRAQLDAAGATPEDNMTVELTLTTPGEVEGGDGIDGGVRWTAPLDGSTPRALGDGRARRRHREQLGRPGRHGRPRAAGDLAPRRCLPRLPRLVGPTTPQAPPHRPPLPVVHLLFAGSGEAEVLPHTSRSRVTEAGSACAAWTAPPALRSPTDGGFQGGKVSFPL